MLVIFRSGPVTDNTANTYDEMDVIDVIPRHKEAEIKQRGLGKKATRLFWVEVDTDRISDMAWNQLAQRIMEPEVEEITDRAIHPIKSNFKTYRVVRKRKMRLDQGMLQNIDKDFNANTVRRSFLARNNYPKRMLTLQQFARVIKNKSTNKNLNGD
jgi:hypothetical protein